MESVLAAVADLSPDRLLCRFSVTFRGEAGIDAGGLTKDMSPPILRYDPPASYMRNKFSSIPNFDFRFLLEMER